MNKLIKQFVETHDYFLVIAQTNYLIILLWY